MIIHVVSDPNNGILILTTNADLVANAKKAGVVAEHHEWDTEKQETALINLIGG